MTLSQTRESAVPTERRGPGTVSRLCPDQPLTLRSTLPAVPPTSEDCTFGTSAAVLLLRWSHAPLAQCGVPHLLSASPESDTGVLRLESVIVPCAGSSIALTKSVHMMYALNLKYHSCHLASSPRKAGGLPNLVSRMFVVGCGTHVSPRSVGCIDIVSSCTFDAMITAARILVRLISPMCVMHFCKVAASVAFSVPLFWVSFRPEFFLNPQVSDLHVAHATETDLSAERDLAAVVNKLLDLCGFTPVGKNGLDKLCFGDPHCALAVLCFW